MTRKAQMPAVNLEKLAETLDEEQKKDIARRIIKADGTIRASKPALPKRTRPTDETDFYGYTVMDYEEADLNQALAAYVWRQVVFAVSPKHEHQCMPTCDIFDLPRGYSLTQMTPEVKYLHNLADDIINCIPVEQWHGVRRWGNALGMIGTPQVRENGSIVYR